MGEQAALLESICYRHMPRDFWEPRGEFFELVPSSPVSLMVTETSWSHRAFTACFGLDYTSSAQGRRTSSGVGLSGWALSITRKGQGEGLTLRLWWLHGSCRRPGLQTQSPWVGWKSAWSCTCRTRPSHISGSGAGGTGKQVAMPLAAVLAHAHTHCSRARTPG